MCAKFMTHQIGAKFIGTKNWNGLIIFLKKKKKKKRKKENVKCVL